MIGEEGVPDVVIAEIPAVADLVIGPDDPLLHTLPIHRDDNKRGKQERVPDGGLSG